MRRSNKFANPFYGLLLIAGISFAITATAYGVMAFREARPQEARPTETQSASSATPVSVVANREHPLMHWMRHHGEAALLAELGLLAVFTFAAIGTDDFWQRRSSVNR